MVMEFDTDAVTDPEMAGNEPTVTVPEMTGRLETVTVDAGSEETVTVPEMAGSEPMVTELPTVTVPATVWVAGKLETVTEPDMGCV